VESKSSFFFGGFSQSRRDSFDAQRFISSTLLLLHMSVARSRPPKRRSRRSSDDNEEEDSNNSDDDGDFVPSSGGSPAVSSVPPRIEPSEMMNDGSAAAAAEQAQSLEDEAAMERPRELEALQELKKETRSSLPELVEAVNAFNRRFGYCNINQNRVDKSTAYYRCGCKTNGCFNVSFTRPKGGAVRLWSINEISSRLCKPREMHAIALDNTFIPVDVKQHLVTLFDQGIPATDAHTQALSFAETLHLDITWEQDDVKNFFHTLRNCFDDTIIRVLEDLQKAGHFVAVDYKTTPTKQRVLNRFFVSFLAMQWLFKIFGSFVTLDSTYGKNWLQFPIQFFVGITSENCLIPFGVGATRSEVRGDYEWLMEMFYKCHQSLPRTFITDGDTNISDAISALAARLNRVVSLLLCIWHLFGNITKQLEAKGQKFDPVELKKDFYVCQRAVSEEVFEREWEAFLEKYGSNDNARNYLEEEIYPKRARWASCWTGCSFHAFIGNTGIG
jgi:hypothetical protein